jgi:hypothetical protein
MSAFLLEIESIDDLLNLYFLLAPRDVLAE